METYEDLQGHLEKMQSRSSQQSSKKIEDKPNIANILQGSAYLEASGNGEEEDISHHPMYMRIQSKDSSSKTTSNQESILKKP